MITTITSIIIFISIAVCTLLALFTAFKIGRFIVKYWLGNKLTLTHRKLDGTSESISININESGDIDQLISILSKKQDESLGQLN